MSKFLLLIDDKEDFMEDFKTVAQRYGYHVAWGKSFEDLKVKMPQLHLQITAVILDVKCLMTNDQEIEKEDFIGAAINYLSKEYSNVPRMILTGDEKALDGLKMFFNSEIEDIYRKEPEQLDKLFQRIDEHNIELPRRILNHDEAELLQLMKNGESKHLEFKSSLQFCTVNKIINKDLRFEVLKNLAAFANTDGGILLIGVDDEHNILGLETNDYTTLKKENKQDEFRLLIDGLVESSFGNGFHNVLSDLKFYIYKGKTVCKITITGKHSTPTLILKKSVDIGKYGAFFVRGQASTRELKDVEKDNYIFVHWK